MSSDSGELRAKSDFDDATWNYHASACSSLIRETDQNQDNLNRDMTQEERAAVIGVFLQLYDEFGHSFMNLFRQKYCLSYNMINNLSMMGCPDFTRNAGREAERQRFENILNKHPNYGFYLKYKLWLHDNAITLSCMRGNAKKLGSVQPPEDIKRWVDGIEQEVEVLGRTYTTFKVAFRHFLIEAYANLIAELDPELEMPHLMAVELRTEAAPEEIMADVEEEYDMDSMRAEVWTRTVELVHEIRGHENCLFMYGAIKFWLNQFRATMNALSLEVYFQPHHVLRPVPLRPINNNQQPKNSEVSIPPFKPLPNLCNGFANFIAQPPKKSSWGIDGSFHPPKSPHVVTLAIKKVSEPDLKKE